MDAKARSKPISVWPTVITSFVVVALAASTASLGVALAKDDGPGAAATGARTTQASAPAFNFGDSAPDSFKARDPRAPAPSTQPAGTLHKATFDIVERQVEIAPGVSQLMWTYNGQVPGPILRGKVGDRFEITLVNRGTTMHSIDFHASKVAPNSMMRTIAPGTSFVYKFTATHSGIFMYHCGTPPVLEHIAMGMYGAVIIDPPNLTPVAHEYVFVQSELYAASTASQAVDYNKLLKAQWDAVVFNGYVNQYVDRPIHVRPTEKIRVWVMDDGPSDIASFHVIGTIFDSVFKEGAYLLQPSASEGGGQALDLGPAQGGFVEFTLPVAGTYPFITHKFADAAQGAAGEFVAGTAPAAAAG